MRRDITFAKDAFAEYLYWQQNDRKTLLKINKLIKEIARTPFEGEGKPEPLIGTGANDWSRRINQCDRLVYEVSDDRIIIKQCKGHYDD